MSQKAEFGHVSPSKAVYSLSHSILLLGDEEEVIYNQEDPNEVDSDLDSLSEDSEDTPLLVRTENSATSIVGASPKIRGRVQRFIRYSFHLP